MSVKTLEQKRALYAWDVINKLKQKENFKSDRILSLFRKLPSMIMHNGLITTTAFLKSKSISKGTLKDEGAVLYALEYYMHHRLEKKEIPEKLESDKFEKSKVESTHKYYSQELLNMDFSRYRLETAEALRIAQWLKRIAEGEIEDEGKGSD